MPAAQTLIRKIADPASKSSISGKARAKRWDVLVRAFPDLADMHVLDLGGRPEYWTAAPVRPAHVTLVNPDAGELSDPLPWMTVLVRDACDPSLDLDGFDLCHANSVIEHVGGAQRRQVFAENVRRAAPKRWVQTPYRYFPIEPHWLFPGFQFLPLRAKGWVSDRWPLAQFSIPGVEAALTTELLTRTEMRHLFPDGDLYSEKVGGLVKSVTAVKA